MEPETKLRDVFISYNQQEADLAARLNRAFEDENLDTFHAPSEVRAGTSFVSAIDNGLRNTQVLVLLLSRSALDSHWVRQEWEAQIVAMSRDRTRRLIPVLLGDLTDNEIPPLLGNLDFVDLRQRDLRAQPAFNSAADGLITKIRSHVHKTVGIPIVIAAMTRREAVDMMRGTTRTGNGQVAPLFGNDGEGVERQQHCVDLLGMLRADFHIQKLWSFYGKSQGDWKPPHRTIRAGFIANWQPAFQEHEPIRAAVEHAVARINAAAPPEADHLWPQFFSNDFFARDAQYRLQVWSYLRQVGCMLIVDAVSLFHPRIVRLIGESQLGGSERVSIISLSPVPPEVLPLNRFLETQVQTRLPVHFDRFSTELAPLSEFGISDARRFTRSLYTILPRVAEEVRGQKASARRREEVRARAEGQQQQAHGIGRSIFGRAKH